MTHSVIAISNCTICTFAVTVLLVFCKSVKEVDKTLCHCSKYAKHLSASQQHILSLPQETFVNKTDRVYFFCQSYRQKAAFTCCDNFELIIIQ